MIPVIWHEGSRGNWDSGLLCDIFDSHPSLFPQYNEKTNPVFDRAIVVVVGKPEIKPLREYLEKTSGIVILTSEEDAFFRWQDAIPEHFDIWTQYYSPTTKSEIKTRLLLGAPNRIKNYTINSHLPKKYLWSFIGQSQNPFRQACIEVAKTLPDGYLHVTDLFGGEGATGVDYQTYLDVLCQSKFVLCPAGSLCVDSFRVYESILAGAIPIVDKRSPRDDKDFDYWNEVYYYHTLLKVDSWHQITPDALELMDSAKDKNVMNNWWGGYVRQLTTKLIDIAHGS